MGKDVRFLKIWSCNQCHFFTTDKQGRDFCTNVNHYQGEEVRQLNKIRKNIDKECPLPIREPWVEATKRAEKAEEELSRERKRYNKIIDRLADLYVQVMDNMQERIREKEKSAT